MFKCLFRADTVVVIYKIIFSTIIRRIYINYIYTAFMRFL